MKFLSFKKVLALSLLFLTPSVFSQVLLVSDIDDTLKNSHILDRSEMIANAFRTDNAFKGLALTYKALQHTHPTTHFAYVSNAMELLSKKSHEKFLNENQFPQGTTHFRESLSDKNHKFRTISELIKNENPELILLVGDNGERDVEIYYAITQAFPEKNILTLIHTVYNSKSHDKEKKGMALAPNQIPYVGVIDFSSVLTKYNLLKEQYMMSLATGYMGSFVTEKSENKGSYFIPKWVSCKDFSRFYSVAENQSLIHPFLRTGFDYLFKRCQR